MGRPAAIVLGLVALALVGVAAARSLRPAPAPDVEVVRSTASPPVEVALPTGPRLRVVDSIPLPDGQPPIVVSLTTDGRRAALASGFGSAQHGTVVVDLEARAARVLPLCGGVLDGARDRVLGMTVDAGSASPDDPDLVVALRLADGGEAWRARVGFCGGALALHRAPGRDLLYVALQGGGRRRPAGPDGPASRGGDDPLFVLDAASGEVLAGPLGEGGVMSRLTVDAAGRAWVSVDQRTRVRRPWPDLTLEDELHGLIPGAIDAVTGRAFLRTHDERPLLALLARPGDAPRRTRIHARDPIAIAGGRLVLTDAAAGRLLVLDVRTLEVVEDQLVVDPDAMQSALAVTPDGRRLLVACASGPRRTLHVVELP